MCDVVVEGAEGGGEGFGELVDVGLGEREGRADLQRAAVRAGRADQHVPLARGPVRPKPGWTSSAMYRPPTSCTAATTGSRHPAGSGRIPSEENKLSAMNAASLTPCRFMSAIDFCTRSANDFSVSS